MNEPASNQPKRRGRPPGPARSPHERMAESTDRILLGWLRHGVKTFTGQFNDDGEPIYVMTPLSAARMQCVLRRLHLIGAANRKYDKHRGAVDLLAEARKKFNPESMRFPNAAQGGRL